MKVNHEAQIMLKAKQTESVISCLGHAKSTASYAGMLLAAIAASIVLPISLLNPTRSI